MVRLDLPALILPVILLNSVVITDTCSIAVHQERWMKVEPTSRTATITCNITATACLSQPNIYWFRYLEQYHEDLCTPNCNNKTFKFKASPLKSNCASLEINELSPNDSGIYICGVAFTDLNAATNKQTGQGTILMVTEPRSPEVTLLIVLTVLLFLYILALLSICLCLYKAKNKEKKHFDGQTPEDEGNKNHKRRILFQEVVQEMYHKRRAWKARRPDNTIDETIYQNT
ncbi:immunoglobulin superfamily member 6 [Lissotriton helveticus]